jgi:hypothetical protein
VITSGFKISSTLDTLPSHTSGVNPSGETNRIGTLAVSR